MNLINHSRHLRTTTSVQLQSGFASVLTVVSISVGLLLLLISMYGNTVESQNTQKDHMLRADYQQREEAFLRAMTNIVPNKAMICMQKNSHSWNTRKTLDWGSIFDEALVLSNSDGSLNSTKATALGISADRSANTAKSNYDGFTVTNNLDGYQYYYTHTTSGTNLTATSEYPPPLECSSWHKSLDGRYPIVSLTKTYGSSATGWVGGNVNNYPLYNLVASPSSHFNYKSDAQIIAKHNWWGFELSMADQDLTNTKLASRKKKYLISLYEIPSQLPINGASYTALGQHTDGTDWANFTIAGGVFAERVKTEGSFSTEAISSRKSVELSGGTTVNGDVTGSTVGSDPFASTARELSESKGQTFPISSAANGGRVAFIPINRGLDFYDRFMGDDRYLGNGNSSSGTNSVSPTSWDYYSLGSQQCRMRLDIIDVVSALDQTPTSIRFTYAENSDGSSLVQETFTKGSNWPDIGTNAGSDFPFHVETSAAGYSCLSVYVERIQSFLTARGANFPEINNSISINPDHVNNAKISRPTFPSTNQKLALLLMDAKDLTAYTKGFSLVTNLRLIIADDVNTTSTTAPADMTGHFGAFYPPLSLFAPEKRYGDSLDPMQIVVDGQLGSLAKGNSTPTRIGDLKSGTSNEVVADNISANLRSLSHPAELPPINIMNWMVLIREIHPTYVPVSTDD